MEQRIVTRAALISLICLISLRVKSSETAEIFDFRKSHEIKPAFRRRPYPEKIAEPTARQGGALERFFAPEGQSAFQVFQSPVARMRQSQDTRCALIFQAKPDANEYLIVMAVCQVRLE